MSDAGTWLVPFEEHFPIIGPFGSGEEANDFANTMWAAEVEIRDAVTPDEWRRVHETERQEES